MDIKQLTSHTNAQSTINKKKSNNSSEAVTKKETSNTPAATYEKSEETVSRSNSKVDHATIAKLKEDADRKTESLRNLVSAMLSKQGITFQDSNFYQTIAEGNYTVSEDVSNQAKKDIAEDGYYGVAQTSDRLVSFAKALSGGDSSKADTMIQAVLDGYEAATKSWGKELPSICKDTLDATIQKLNDWKASLNS